MVTIRAQDFTTSHIRQHPCDGEPSGQALVSVVPASSSTTFVGEKFAGHLGLASRSLRLGDAKVTLATISHCGATISGSLDHNSYNSRQSSHPTVGLHIDGLPIARGLPLTM